MDANTAVLGYTGVWMRNVRDIDSINTALKEDTMFVHVGDDILNAFEESQARFLNHSCHPNAALVQCTTLAGNKLVSYRKSSDDPHLYLIVKRPIKKGEE